MRHRERDGSALAIFNTVSPSVPIPRSSRQEVAQRDQRMQVGGGGESAGMSRGNQERVEKTS